MKVINKLSLMKKETRPVFLAAGFFDGIHLGHRKVIQRTIRDASKKGGKAWVLTFDRHPASVLKNKPVPLMLTSKEHKIILLEKMGLDGCIVMPFNRKLADTPPETFISHLLSAIPSIKGIYVGTNWRFGRKGQGTTELLKELGQKMGFSARIVSPALQDGRPISSTIVRKMIIKGDLAAAGKMYGRAFSILGTVVKGQTLGRKLGFPTANINPQNEVFPPYGVYAVTAVTGRRHMEGVLNYGTRPTFNSGKQSSALIELHILNFKGELYGKLIEVFFHGRIRAEKRFPSESALQEQIEKDITMAKEILHLRK